MKSPKITPEIAREIGDQLKVDWSKISPDEFRKGMIVELEHGNKNPDTNVTDNDLLDTGKIALVHLRESHDYYKDLPHDAEPEEGEKEYLIAEMPENFKEITKNNSCGNTIIDALQKFINGELDAEDLYNLPIEKDDPVNNLLNKLGGIDKIIDIVENDLNGIDKAKEIISRLRGIHNAIRANIFRHVYSCIQEAKNGENTEKNKLIAVKTIDKLCKQSANEHEKEQLRKIKACILNGDSNNLDIASVRVKNIFASYIPNQNIRVAYTTLRQQDGEAYQLCPKMVFQIGYAVPMELSKCREQCIDSKISPSGKIICGYADWVKYISDNQNAVNSRIEVHKNPDEEIVIGTLSYPQRTINTGNQMYDTIENKIDNIREESVYSPTYNIESRLDTVKLYNHKDGKNESLRIQNLKSKTAAKNEMKGINPYCEDGMNYGAQISYLTPDGSYADKTIEAMLQDKYSGLTEGELDELMNMTSLLRNKRTTKTFNLKKARIAARIAENINFRYHDPVHDVSNHKNYLYVKYLDFPRENGEDVLLQPIDKNGNIVGKPVARWKENLVKGWSNTGEIYCSKCGETTEATTDEYGNVVSECCDSPVSTYPVYDNMSDINDYFLKSTE